jgi:hypothetical protein
MAVLCCISACRLKRKLCTAEAVLVVCCVIQKAKHGAKQPEERRLSVEQLDREKLKDHLLKHKR